VLDVFKARSPPPILLDGSNISILISMVDSDGTITVSELADGAVDSENLAHLLRTSFFLFPHEMKAIREALQRRQLDLQRMREAEAAEAELLAAEAQMEKLRLTLAEKKKALHQLPSSQPPTSPSDTAGLSVATAGGEEDVVIINTAAEL